ncbi:hypothetical protein [Acaryochloris marina]
MMAIVDQVNGRCGRGTLEIAEL